MWWLTIPVVIYSAALLVLWIILIRKGGNTSTKGEKKTLVTVVVAVHNEEKHITSLLQSLSVQDYPSDLLEIIIVNDNSTDRTPIVISGFIEKMKSVSDLRINLIYNLSHGKKSAVLHGVKKASGELIITTDADCIVGSGWVGAHAGIFESSNADMILGEVYQYHARGFAASFGMLEFSALQSVTEATALAGYPVMCNGANMSFRRDLYLRLADELKPDIVSGDDMFLLHAVRRAGGVIRYAGGSEAAAETAPAVTAAALFRQRARWASKTTHYTDAATITCAAAAAAANAATAAAAVASLLSATFLPLLGILYSIRLIPDYLIIAYNIKKRKGHMPLIMFLLSELLYPLYFVIVAILSLLPSFRSFSNRS